LEAKEKMISTVSDAVQVQWLIVLGLSITSISGVWSVWLMHRVHKNTNSLVERLIDKADQEGYDRAKQEQKDEGD